MQRCTAFENIACVQGYFPKKKKGGDHTYLRGNRIFISINEHKIYCSHIFALECVMSL